jgi:hypothetical protein
MCQDAHRDDDAANDQMWHCFLWDVESDAAREPCAPAETTL